MLNSVICWGCGSRVQGPSSIPSGGRRENQKLTVWESFGISLKTKQKFPRKKTKINIYSLKINVYLKKFHTVYLKLMEILHI
jgi:hypothetical protein